jgi:hypothetical protein
MRSALAVAVLELGDAAEQRVRAAAAAGTSGLHKHRETPLDGRTMPGLRLFLWVWEEQTSGVV